ncbi:hypothetical protein PI124_g14762 [Phytophthora idaei]|nr:hypothetical protein PI125_g14404 [Phytophthora idaei]KAG3147165.1 hypothetical protein PI126_g12975 [Phytophthora idaei]KAG3240336.1 hypothetical protein PI124_g14762 [Phytophthora idaei]
MQDPRRTSVALIPRSISYKYRDTVVMLLVVVRVASKCINRETRVVSTTSNDIQGHVEANIIEAKDVTVKLVSEGDKLAKL